MPKSKESTLAAAMHAIPQNYKDLPTYKNGDVKTRRKLASDFRKQEAAAAEAARKAKVEKDAAEFEAKRPHLAAALAMKFLALKTRAKELEERGGSYLKNTDTPDRVHDGLTSAFIGVDGATPSKEAFGTPALILSVSVDDLRGWHYADASVNLLTDSLYAFKDMDRELDELADALVEYEEDYKAAVEKAEREEAAKRDRNAQRAALRASLTPEQAALLSPDER